MSASRLVIALSCLAVDSDSGVGEDIAVTVINVIDNNVVVAGMWTLLALLCIILTIDGLLLRRVFMNSTITWINGMIERHKLNVGNVLMVGALDGAWPSEIIKRVTRSPQQHVTAVDDYDSPAAKATKLDANENIEAEIRTIREPCQYEVVSAHPSHLPFPTEQYDVVVSGMTLSIQPTEREMVKSALEMVRVLRVGGLFVGSYMATHTSKVKAVLRQAGLEDVQVRVMLSALPPRFVVYGFKKTPSREAAPSSSGSFTYRMNIDVSNAYHASIHDDRSERRPLLGGPGHVSDVVHFKFRCVIFFFYIALLAGIVVAAYFLWPYMNVPLIVPAPARLNRGMVGPTMAFFGFEVLHLWTEASLLCKDGELTEKALLYQFARKSSYHFVMLVIVNAIYWVPSLLLCLLARFVGLSSDTRSLLQLAAAIITTILLLKYWPSGKKTPKK
eukprot:TRINITY_DN5354_c0_g1_i1.p1 TRINITY_DN5354_c0_g1~~TRINITY_DN5354_c0_g1_i1.p1  ORF type:complete len:523 (-),score=53.21 TRINITY_DN5354_c0_g1_i1:14-1348(-)